MDAGAGEGRGGSLESLAVVARVVILGHRSILVVVVCRRVGCCPLLRLPCLEFSRSLHLLFLGPPVLEPVLGDGQPSATSNAGNSSRRAFILGCSTLRSSAISRFLPLLGLLCFWNSRS